VADLVRAGSALGDAIAGRRTLGREDRTVLGTLALIALATAALAGFFPWIVGWIVAFLAGWFGIVLGVRSLHQARRARREEEEGGRVPQLSERGVQGVVDAGPERAEDGGEPGPGREDFD